MNNPFLKYLIKDKKEDIVHSSAYAKAQNEEGIGVASTQSFEERQRIEENRQQVRKYRDSGIMQRSRMNAPKAKVYVEPAGNGPGGPNLNNAAQGRAMMQRRNPGIVRK